MPFLICASWPDRVYSRVGYGNMGVRDKVGEGQRHVRQSSREMDGVIGARSHVMSGLRLGLGLRVGFIRVRVRVRVRRSLRV